MSEIRNYLQVHQPCPECDSSDAYSIFETDNDEIVGYCWSCGMREVLETDEEPKPVLVKDDKFIAVETIEKDYRSLTPDTLETFDVRKNGNQIVYHYKDYSGETKAQKMRFKNEKGKKAFSWKRWNNDVVGLFGCHLFAKGGKTITITEGENDAMAVYQMNGNYPVVSIKNGAETAKKLSEKDVEYLDSFSEIVVCFDGDKPGRKATEDFCAIFPTKVKIVEFPAGYKDAHAMLEAGKAKEFKNSWFNAKPWSPSNIVYPIDIIEDIVNPPKFEIIPYPWESLNNQIFGMHFPEVVVWKARPKVGKSLITAALATHIHKTTDYLVADITVENTPEERARTLLSLYCHKPLHLKLVDQNVGISDADIRKAANEFFGDRRLILFEKEGITSPEAILAKIDYFIEVLGCKVLIFDHINYLTSYHESDERKALDKLTNILVDKAKDKRVCLHIVSHVNDEGQTFGSRNLVKAGYTVIDLDRDKGNKNEFIRNLTTLKVQESRRYGSRIGQPIYLKYDEDDYSLNDLDPEIVEDELKKLESESELDV